MGHYYLERRVPVTISSGRCKGRLGIVDSAVFHLITDYSDLDFEVGNFG